MTVEHPLWLAAAAGLPLLVLALVLLRRWAVRGRRRFGERDDVLTRSVPPSRTAVRLVLMTAALSMIAVALADIRWGYREYSVVSRGIDVVFALDTSLSMRCADVSPHRLGRARGEILRFTERLGDDRTALIVFSGVSAALCPLTGDRYAFRLLLETVEAGMLGDSGTDLRSAVNASVELFRREELRHRVLILVSDGEHQGRKLDTAIQTAKQENVWVYAVSVGTDDGAPVPVLDDEGRVQGYMQKNGKQAVSKRQTQTLRRIARETGGRYINANRAGSLEEIYRDIKQRAAVKRRDAKRKRRESRYYYAAAAAAVCLILVMVLPFSRRFPPKKIE
jgi:Ca-activated chloride channel homolog